MVDNRLPAPSRNDPFDYNPQTSGGVALQVAGATPRRSLETIPHENLFLPPDRLPRMCITVAWRGDSQDRDDDPEGRKNVQRGNRHQEE